MSRGVTPPPSPWLKVMSLSGLLMTVLYCAYRQIVSPRLRTDNRHHRIKGR